MAHTGLRRKKIMVTKEMIEQAIAEKSGRCMVSMAIRAAYPKAKSVETDLTDIRVEGARGFYIYRTPYSVQGRLGAFDAGRGDLIEPWSFYLQRPSFVKEHRSRRRKGKQAKLPKEGLIVKETKENAPSRGPQVRRTIVAVGGRVPPQVGILGDKDRVYGLRRYFGIAGKETNHILEELAKMKEDEIQSSS